MAAAVSAGQAWQLSAQPNWIAEAVQVPETGSVMA
jgi:hypothetical protein